MLDAKTVADLITFMRGMLGLVMIWLGFMQGEAALTIVAAVMLLDWTGDFVDGGIARHSSHPRQTWIGDSDIYVDVWMSVCLAIYLVSAGFVNFALGFWYAFAWVTILRNFGLEKNLLMLLQAPIYLWFIVVTLRLEPQIGNWLIAWVAIALAINWRRFSTQIVPTFIRAIASLGRSRRS